MSVKLEYVNEENYELDFDFEKIAESILNKGLEDHNCPFDCEISLTVTSPEGIRELNSQMRGMDKVTDVLSFPNIEFPAEADFSVCEAEDNYYDYFNPETGKLVLGDIVICYERALSQAEEYGHSILREMSFLTAHSLLHLLGYDHEDDEERERMEDMQRTLLEELGIKR